MNDYELSIIVENGKMVITGRFKSFDGSILLKCKDKLRNEIIDLVNNKESKDNEFPYRDIWTDGHFDEANTIFYATIVDNIIIEIRKLDELVYYLNSENDIYAITLEDGLI